MTMTAQDLANRLGGTLEGDGAAAVSAVAGLEEARVGDLSFCKDVKHVKVVATTKATAILLPRDWKDPAPCAAVIRVDDPNVACMAAAALFAPPAPVRRPGIHPSAVIGKGVTLGKDVHVGAYTVIEDGAVIGDGCVIECQCFIGEGCRLGAGCHLYPQVTLREGSVLGKGVILHCGVRIGGDGYGYTTKVEGAKITIEKIPQLGIVELDDDVEIGSNTTIDRARIGRTRIGAHTKIDNLVQIGHNVQVGACSGLIAQSGVAGSAHIGSGVLIWAQAGISGHIHVNDRAQVGPQAGVPRDVEPGAYVIGTPAQSLRETAAIALAPRQIMKLNAAVRELKAAVAAIKPQKTL